MKKLNMIIIFMFSLVYNHLKIEIYFSLEEALYF